MATVLEIEPPVEQVAVDVSPSVSTPANASERQPYLFTAEQALEMAKAGIFEGVGKVELWDGVFYQMNKYEPHNCVVMAVATALRTLLPPGHLVREEKSCSADPLSLPEPDIVVHKGGLWDHFNGPPPALAKMELLVEVNYSTPEDYSTKLAKYAKASVPTYWVVDVNARNIAVFTKPQPDNSRYGASKTFAKGDNTEVVLEDRSVGIVPVSDLFPPDARA